MYGHPVPAMAFCTVLCEIKKSLDGMCNIMVGVEDAFKINRVVERFKGKRKTPQNRIGYNASHTLFDITCQIPNENNKS